jgi:hypothetical protein
MPYYSGRMSGLFAVAGTIRRRERPRVDGRERDRRREGFEVISRPWFIDDLHIDHRPFVAFGRCTFRMGRSPASSLRILNMGASPQMGTRRCDPDVWTTK